MSYNHSSNLRLLGLRLFKKTWPRFNLNMAVFEIEHDHVFSSHLEA